MSLINLIVKNKEIFLKLLPYSLLRSLNRKFVISRLNIDAYKNKIPFNKNQNENGINILINKNISSLSLDRSVNILDSLFEKSNISRKKYDYTKTNIQEELQYNVNLFHAGPIAFFTDIQKIDRSVFDGKYNILYFIWELEVPPPTNELILDLFDEIWCLSKYASNCLLKEAEKKKTKVKVMPYYIEANEGNYKRSDFGIDEDKFVILTMHDENSNSGRKNSEGVIDAFKKAFPKENENVVFIIKVANADANTISKLNTKLKEYKNIKIINEKYTEEKLNSLFKISDLFITLPRAEGFGLMMAEAMYLGVAVITTGYSAPLEYSVSDESEAVRLIPYKYIPLKKKDLLYQKGAKWADADLNEAAKSILELYNNPEKRKELAKNGQKLIKEKYSKELRAKRAREAFDEIYI